MSSNELKTPLDTLICARRSVIAPFLIPWEAYHLVVSATRIPLWHR